VQLVHVGKQHHLDPAEQGFDHGQNLVVDAEVAIPQREKRFGIHGCSIQPPGKSRGEARRRPGAAVDRIPQLQHALANFLGIGAAPGGHALKQDRIVVKDEDVAQVEDDSLDAIHQRLAVRRGC
jgi:hypothetical protein